jgi:quinol monooxygenase YgiN
MEKFITSVRFKVKEGKSEEFIKRSKEIGKYKQAIDNFTFQTSENTFCFVGIFENELAIIDARPHMISNLDKIRDLLEIISTDLGVTDPVSGLTID